ncbi:hypothetical protein AAVH_38185 [Aphelenchoides avenae]|nr:hypothetical protein AAVH_38185 [Aphelenchus avenae]
MHPTALRAFVVVVLVALADRSDGLIIKRQADRQKLPGELYSVPLANVPGKTVTSVIVEYGPGETSPPHMHGTSFVVAYVLEGAITSQVGHDGHAGPLHTYKAGEMWLEQPGDHHLASSNASKDKGAKLLAVLIHNSNDTGIFTLL